MTTLEKPYYNIKMLSHVQVICISVILVCAIVPYFFRYKESYGTYTSEQKTAWVTEFIKVCMFGWIQTYSAATIDGKYNNDKHAEIFQEGLNGIFGEQPEIGRIIPFQDLSAIGLGIPPIEILKKTLSKYPRGFDGLVSDATVDKIDIRRLTLMASNVDLNKVFVPPLTYTSDQKKEWSGEYIKACMCLWMTTYKDAFVSGVYDYRKHETIYYELHKSRFGGEIIERLISFLDLSRIAYGTPPIEVLKTIQGSSTTMVTRFVSDSTMTKFDIGQLKNMCSNFDLNKPFVQPENKAVPQVTITPVTTNSSEFDSLTVFPPSTNTVRLPGMEGNYGSVTLSSNGPIITSCMCCDASNPSGVTCKVCQC
jgi:hypothetical protein